MPFFTQTPWIEHAGRIWLWVILTIPSTILAFLFYIYWKRRQWRVKTPPGKDVENGGSSIRMGNMTVEIESDDEE
jgi:hypothetical protein